MFCDFKNLANRHFLFCLLGFTSSTASSCGLLMSSYSLAKYRDNFTVENYITCVCILITIITHAIKDSLISNPELLKKNANDINNNFVDI